ncbi:MAG: tRNA (N6-threonylcarbamoyladenosine(37)-N6)-methyltransferase TrmO [Clostridia bacterium]|nr:tRNA (N6-threonylcarbamoyladenosine(37)-N6)-methyltransferase TrmO [Clostridia bacterium]
MHVIARIHNDFPTKFGLPRQSGLVSGLRSMIVFEPEYRVPDALRGMEGYSHLWLIWQFHQAERDTWSPTVRPPRLGGNARMGVFATRSPFRPNPIGLSCVKLEAIQQDAKLGTVLIVSGADLMDGTPIYDIKPYLPYADCHPEATGGFAHEVKDHAVEVVIPEAMLAKIPPDKREALQGVLAQDPRPGYQKDPERVYGFTFAGMEVRFRVAEDVLTVTEIVPMEE